MKTIKKISFKDHWGDPVDYKIGENTTKISEHAAQGEGDKWFYDVHLKNGDIMRVFCPSTIVFTEQDEDTDIPF